MTEPSEDRADYEFGLAVSFAGENRDYVEDIVRKLNESTGVKVFYDQDHRYDSWGEDGVEYFINVYMNRARYVAMFISTHYAQKEWPRLEKRAALSRAIRQKSAYILPIRLDDTELDGLLPTVNYIEAVQEGIDGIVAGILHKLGSARAKAKTKYHGGVAQNAEELQELISQRTPGWEYVLFASVLNLERQKLAPQRRDHQIRYAAPNGKRIDTPHNADAAVDDVLVDLLHFAEDFNRILDDDVQTDAFGEPGVAGDPDRIIHIAERFIEVYNRLLHIAADLRGTRTHPELSDLIELAAAITNSPLNDLDKFIDRYIALANGIAARLSAGENVVVEMDAQVTLDDDAKDALSAERQRLQNLYGPY